MYMKKEKYLTDKQLRRKIKFFRFMMSLFGGVSLKKKSRRTGTEMFIPTNEGPVRVLTYNMDNPQRLPLYVNLHGGGFVLGNPEIDDPFMPDIAEKANVKIISIDYSLAPEFPFPKALNECYAVIQYVKEHPDEFGINPDRIAVGGHSAGGNLSAGICLMDNDARQLGVKCLTDNEPKQLGVKCLTDNDARQLGVKYLTDNEPKQLGIKCLILDYPPMDLYTEAGSKPLPKGALPVFMCRLFDACYMNDKEARRNPLISPVYATIDDVRNFPPTLVITAQFDSLCGEGEQFRDLLITAGVAVTHKRFEAKHGFNLAPGVDSAESWQLMIDHLKRYLWDFVK